MWTGSLSRLFTRSNQIMFHKVLQKPISRRSVGQLMIKAAVFFFFFKKTSHSVRQSSLIMSGPDDRASMEAAVNGKYSVRVRRQHISRGSPVAALKMWGREKLMRLFSHPQHNLLRWEGGCEARAEGKSVMTLFHPSGSEFTGRASPSSTRPHGRKLRGRPRGPRCSHLYKPESGEGCCTS